MFVFGIIINTAFGLLLLFLAYMIGRKERIDILHSYHTKRVLPEDIKDYSQNMGLAFGLMGCGSLAGALIDYLNKNMDSGWLVMMSVMFISFVWMFMTQRKYNGGVF